MEFLDFEEVSFRPDANIGHLCENLKSIVGEGFGYDTFDVQNTKWLWLVNNVFTALNGDNMHCACFGQYASFVAGILNSVKEINFYVLCNKRRLHYANYLKKCISNTPCTISCMSRAEDYFLLASGEEKVVITFESRVLRGKLLSKLTFAYAVLNKILVRLSSLTYGTVCINKRVIYVTN